MLAAIGRGHLKVIKVLLEQDNFDPKWCNREGKTYWELAEECRGPRWQHERDTFKDRYTECHIDNFAYGAGKKRTRGRSGSIQIATATERIETTATAAPSHLPSLCERDETPDPITTAIPTVLKTPQTEKKHTSFFANFTTRTPKNKTPIQPSNEEMHPHHHQASTAKPLDEARWLGFLNKGAHTEPVKGVNKIPAVDVTPSKTPDPSKNPFSSPDFKFTFRKQSLELSPAARKMMAESREEAAKVRAQMVAQQDEFAARPAVEDATGRKIAPAKGKASRFSDVHMAQFKKMDSIANHPSAFRTDSIRAAQGSTSLKRTQSKADLGDRENGSSRTKSQKSQHAAREEVISGPVKRAKHRPEDDTSAARPVSRDNTSDESKPSTPKGTGLIRSKSGIPQPTSNLTTPTKASIARSQSVKSMKTSMIPSLARSSSVKSLANPQAADARREDYASRMKSTVKSILRGPQRLYSNDPAKIAAGTHIATPKGRVNLNKDLPSVPATAPVAKHVNFTSSTLYKALHDDAALASPSAAHSAARSASEKPERMASPIPYPSLPDRETITNPNASRRLTTGGMPADFTFRSDKPISFGPATAVKGTIRPVRNSDAVSFANLPGVPTGASPVKRKLESVNETSDKENEEDESRPTKKSRPTEQPPVPKMPASRLPKRTKPSRQSITLASAVQSYIQEALQDPRIQPYVPRRLQQYLPQKPPPSSPLAARFTTWFNQLQRELQQRFGQTPVQQPPESSNPIIALASTYPIYTTALIAVLLYLFFTNIPIMSWTSRLGGWSGKFSPFGRDPQNAQVKDSDFSYITSDDLRRNLVPPTSGPRPDKDTDVLVLKHRKISYPIHFPRDSIDRGELTIGEIRNQAAKKMGADPRRIKLFYKGRNMADDSRLAREEGLRSDLESEILCSVGDAALSSDSGVPLAETMSAGSDDEDDAEDGDSAVNSTPGREGAGKKKRRHRKKKSKKGGASGTSTPPTSTGTHTPTAEFLGIPSAPPPRPTSAPAAPRSAPPESPLDKLDAIASTFHTKFVPDCIQFTAHPPADKAKREFEHKKLTEMILAQVLLKLDGVETEGVEGAREKRKALVREVQAMMNKLDEVAKQ
ncbi:hypothetical protein H2201_001676 [Coniosporium apollinis]|uniref:BAG domain-containing protein n=1 Tax=Coniosporium apollinis TaxID=61459 RepID=A0ABQ9P2R0_9PEZI|nr:hypothetical protein H2201_001676 [Coniosporium apollinis]